MLNFKEVITTFVFATKLLTFIKRNFDLLNCKNPEQINVAREKLFAMFPTAAATKHSKSSDAESSLLLPLSVSLEMHLHSVTFLELPTSRVSRTLQDDFQLLRESIAVFPVSAYFNAAFRDSSERGMWSILFLFYHSFNCELKLKLISPGQVPN